VVLLVLLELRRVLLVWPGWPVERHLVCG